jgi:chromosome segregation ATPase
LEAELARMRGELDRVRVMHDGDRQRLQSQIQGLESELAEAERQRMVVIEETRTARTTRAVDETALKSLKEKYDRDREQMMAENLRLQEQFAEAQRVGAQYQSVIAQMRQQKPSNTHLLSQIDELNRRLDDASAVKRQLDEVSRENRRMAEDNQRLLHEKEEMADKVRFFLEEQNNAAKKELDMERVFREATSQVRRLDAQLGEVESVARSIGGSAGGGVGSAGTTSLGMSTSMRRGVASASPQASMVVGMTGGTGAPWRP